MDDFLNVEDDIPLMDDDQVLGPISEQLVDSSVPNQEEFDVIPLITQQAHVDCVSKKRNARGTDAGGSDLASKMSKSRKTADKEGRLVGVHDHQPLASDREKGSCSNPLLNKSLVDGATLIGDWLHQNYSRIAELEKLLEKLKYTKAELKKTSDQWSNSQVHLSSIEIELNRKLKDQEKSHNEVLQTNQTKIQTLESDLAQARDELLKLKEEKANLVRESIITYVPSDTFSVNRLEEFWEKVDKFITPHLKAYVAHLKKFPNPWR